MRRSEEMEKKMKVNKKGERDRRPRGNIKIYIKTSRIQRGIEQFGRE